MSVRQMVRAMMGMVAVGLLSVGMASTGAAAPAGPDYAREETWLCRPGRGDICSRKAADDNRNYTARADAPVDCFYIYGTVSKDPGEVSDMNPGADEEELVTRIQLAPYASRCRLFVP